MAIAKVKFVEAGEEVLRRRADDVPSRLLAMPRLDRNSWAYREIELALRVAWGNGVSSSTDKGVSSKRSQSAD
jgi:hypothetical protein